MRKLILLTEHEKRDRFCQEIYNVKRDLEQGGNMRENQNKIYQNIIETVKRLEDYIKGIIEYIFYNLYSEKHFQHLYMHYQSQRIIFHLHVSLAVTFYYPLIDYFCIVHGFLYLFEYIHSSIDTDDLAHRDVKLKK